METDKLFDSLNLIEKKDNESFKMSITRRLNEKLLDYINGRKSEIAAEILGEAMGGASIVTPSAEPGVSLKPKMGTIKPPPPSKGTPPKSPPTAQTPKNAPTKSAGAADALKAKAELAKAKIMNRANDVKQAAVDVKKNVIDPEEEETMRKEIDAATDSSLDILSLKPVPGGFEVKTKQDDGINPTLDKEFLLKTFLHKGRMIELKQMGLGMSRPIRSYIDGKRWNFFPGMESAEEMTKNHINLLAKQEKTKQKEQQ